MKFSKILAAGLISAAAVGAVAGSGSAMAAGRHGGWHGGHGGWSHGHGHGHGYGYAGAVIGSAIVAGALLSPWYYPSYYSTYPTVVEVSYPAPTVYYEQAPVPVVQQVAASDAGNWWYFCNDTRAYYPYVRECATPWQRVVPNPAPASAPQAPR